MQLLHLPRHVHSRVAVEKLENVGITEMKTSACSQLSVLQSQIHVINTEGIGT